MSAGNDHDPADRGRAEAEDARAQELAWLRAIAQGDRAAFERLYLRYYDRLARFLARHTARRELIDEIVNETLWVVWRSARDFRGDSKVGTWIIGIAYRCLLKSLRDAGAHAAADPRAAPSEPVETPDSDESDRRELRDWLGRGLKLLPPEQRTTIELAYFLGQSCEEIAAIMNVAVGTVKARMFHARVRLRNTLPELGGERPRGARSA